MASNSAQSSAFESLPVYAKVLVGVLMLTLVSLAYWVVFYTDVASRLTKADREQSTLQNDLAKAKQEEAAYQKDLTELNERQQRARTLTKVLPETASYPTFLSSLQGVANVAEITLVGWAPLNESFESFYAKVPLRLNIKGKFHQIAKFLYGVGQLDRITNVEQISLSDAKEVDGELIINAECIAIAFRTITPEEAKTAKANNPKRGKK